MFERIFMIGLLGHIVGDFYLQTNICASRKKDLYKNIDGIKAYFLHILLYSISQFIFFNVVLQSPYKIPLTICISHAIIDAMKILLQNKNINKAISERLYFLDQGFHVLIILIMAVLAVKLGWYISFNENLKEMLYIIGISDFIYIKIGVLALILHKPMNITIKEALGKYKAITEIDDIVDDPKTPCISNNINSGALIGTLERLIIVILLCNNAYSSIAFIFAAKSLARYDKISKDKEFAEYYLMGSLFSVFATLLLYGIIVQ